MGDGSSYHAELVLVHCCIFPQHNDWAGLVKDQKVLRLDPVTLDEEDAQPDTTSTQRPQTTLGSFLLARTIVFLICQ